MSSLLTFHACHCISVDENEYFFVIVVTTAA